MSYQSNAYAIDMARVMTSVRTSQIKN